MSDIEQLRAELKADIARIDAELEGYHRLMMALRQGWLLSVDQIEKMPSVNVAPRTSELRRVAKGK